MSVSTSISSLFNPADAEDVGPGTGWLGLSRDLRLREAEVTQVGRGPLIQGAMCLGWRKALWFPDLAALPPHPDPQKHLGVLCLSLLGT